MADSIAPLNSALSDRYAIERELGQGGMATVYLARDLRHDRQVAIKVLKPDLAAILGAERFVQEIKTTANLQHPHILPLFNSGQADGFLFYVMPYVEGESLRDKLNREKQLGVEEAVRIATEVADALDYAHRQDVIHRDIKPENILLHDGRPMVADFGIALAVSAAAGARLTETGLSLGTPHYMSPEQATGEREITGRSDIYSLAAVLYEMLTGDPPHTGATAQQIILRIVTEDARPIEQVRKAVPRNVAAAVAKALEKLPADRFESVHAFAEALADPTFSRTEIASPATAARAPKRQVPLGAFLITAAVLMVVLVGSIWLATRQASDANQIQYLPVGITNPIRAIHVWSDGVQLAPDGNRIAYHAGGGRWRLLDLSDGTNRPVSSEVRGNDVSFSPSGDSIAQTTVNWMQQIHVVDLATGRATQVTDSAQGQMKWAHDGWIYYRSLPYGLSRVRVTDGRRETVVRPETHERWYAVNPVPLRDGRGVVYTRIPRSPRNPAQSEIVALDLQSGESRVLTRGIEAQVVKLRYLLVAQLDGSLLAGRFDARTLDLEGPFVRVLDGVEIRELWQAGAPFTLADDGTLLYVQARPIVEDTVVLVDRTGRRRRVLPTWGGTIGGGLAYSEADRRWAANVHRGLRTPNVLVRAGDEDEPRRITFGEVLDYNPRILPISSDVAFVSPREGDNWDLYRVPFDGAGAPTRILDRPGDITLPRFSADGRWVVFCERGLYGQRDVQAHRFGADSTTVTLAATDAGECSPDISPDAKWVVYWSDESGRREIYVKSLEKPSDARWQISTDEGQWAQWGRGARELLYVNAQREIVAVPVTADETFAFGSPQVLFKLDENSYWTGELTENDELIVVRQQLEAPGQVVLIRNFLELLREKVGE